MIKRLSFLCALLCQLINVAAFASDLDSPQEGMGERTFAFYGMPFRRAAVPILSSNELDREPSELIPYDEHDYSENDPIRYISYLFDNELIDQEALVRETMKITNAFKTVIELATSEVKSLILNSANLEADFNLCFTQLNDWYSYVLNGRFSDNQKFRSRNAMQTLALLNGDVTISRHRISSVGSYSNFVYPTLPNAKQLFVFACKLADVGNPRKFIFAYLAENFADPSKWRLWKKHFERFFPGILTHDDLGLALAADEESGGKFIGAMAEFLRFGETLPCAVTNCADLRISSNLLKAYIHNSLEKINSISEALFMARRGHNIGLFDAFEQNKPACAEGLYLHLLRETAAMLNNSEMFIDFKLEHCA